MTEPRGHHEQFQAAKRGMSWLPILPGVLLAVLGVCWLGVFYLSSGRYPVLILRYWNLAVGGALLCLGFVATLTVSLVLLITARSKSSRR
jgi:hypothetical protein